MCLPSSGSRCTGKCAGAVAWLFPCHILQDDVPRVLGMDWTKVILLPTLGVCREAGPQGRDTYTGYITILFGLFACWEVSEAGCC